MPILRVSVPDRRLADSLSGLPDGVEVLVWDLTDAPPADRIDIVVPPYFGAVAETLHRIPAVRPRLIQSQMIGYEGVEGQWLLALSDEQNIWKLQLGFDDPDLEKAHSLSIALAAAARW